jgi:hypothetical protein
MNKHYWSKVVLAYLYSAAIAFAVTIFLESLDRRSHSGWPSSALGLAPLYATAVAWHLGSAEGNGSRSLRRMIPLGLVFTGMGLLIVVAVDRVVSWQFGARSAVVMSSVGVVMALVAWTLWSRAQPRESS